MRLVPIDLPGAVEPDISAAGPVTADVLQATLALYGRKGYRPPWNCYFALDEDRCVGTCGFAGPPQDGEVEIAYFTFPGNEGQGIATRMARELMAMTRGAALAGGIRFIAHTLPVEGASTKILQRLGFQLQGLVEHPEDGPVWKWRLAKHGDA